MKLLKVPSAFVLRLLFVVMSCTLCAHVAAAQQTPTLTLDNNSALFTVLAGMNACGYNEDLDQSSIVRTQIRNEMAEAAQRTPEAQESLARWCRFYMDHQQGDAARQLSQ